MDFIFKINKFMLSDKYRYVDMVIGVIFLLYAMYLYTSQQNINYFYIISGIIILILGITDFTRKGFQKIIRGFIREVD